jgi:hypothetical protein
MSWEGEAEKMRDVVPLWTVLLSMSVVYNLHCDIRWHSYGLPMFYTKGLVYCTETGEEIYAWISMVSRLCINDPVRPNIFVIHIPCEGYKDLGPVIILSIMDSVCWFSIFDKRK